MAQSDTGHAVENGVLDDPSVARYFADVSVGCGTGLNPAAYLFPFFAQIHAHCLANDVAVVPLTTDFDEVLGTLSSVEIRLLIVPVTAVTRGAVDLSFVAVNTRDKRQVSCYFNLSLLFLALIIHGMYLRRHLLLCGLVFIGFGSLRGLVVS